MLFALSFLTLFVGIPEVVGSSLAASWEAPTVTPEVMAKALQEATQLYDQGRKQLGDNPPVSKGCPCQDNQEQGDQTRTGGMPESAPLASPTNPEKTNQLLIFISLSMPEASLKGLAREASQNPSSQRYNTVFVLRGLYQDSFVKTAQKLQALGLSADIHPELFETHKVTSVPTFVFVRDSVPTHRLKGNVTLGFAVQKVQAQPGVEEKQEGDGHEGQ